jgi:tetratricopeptide (TPR) repeat protein
MSSARRTVFATLLFLLLTPALVFAAEPAVPDSAAAVPDSVAPVPEIRERELKAKIEARPGDAALVMDLATFYYDQGDRNRAENQYRRALELDPRNTAAMVRLGTVLNESGKSEDALVQFDAALQIEPRRVDTLCRKGQALYAVKRHEEAVHLYLEAKKIDPKDQMPYYWLGIAFADAAIYREAIVEWSAVVAIDKDSELGRAAAEGIEVLRPMVGISGP